jgi:hypothetical protein
MGASVMTERITGASPRLKAWTSPWYFTDSIAS